MAQQVLEGTWEEIALQADRFSGKRVRITVLENGFVVDPTARPAYATATPQERARAFREWAESHPRDTPILSEEAISRESIYFGDHDQCPI